MFHETLYGPGADTVPSGLQTPVLQLVLWFEHSKNCTCVTPLPPGSLAVAEKLVGLGSEPLIAGAGAVIATAGGALSTRMLVFSTLVAFDASSVARARRSYRPSPAGSVAVFQDAPVAVYALGGSVWSLYANAIAGLAGEASLDVAASDTIPLTIAPDAGLEKLRAGGVLSTRVVTSADVVELPATSVAVTRRS